MKIHVVWIMLHECRRSAGSTMSFIKKHISKAPLNLLEGVIWKKILLFAFPILLGSFFQQMYNMVDAIIIGRAVSANALAAVGATATTTSLMVGVFTAVSGGAAVVISQYFGAKDKENVGKAVHTAIAFALVGGIALMALGFILARPLMKLTNVPDEIIDDAVLYMQVFFAGMIGNLLYNIETGILRAVGDSRTPLIVLSFTSVLNVILDLTFVLWLKWGVFGVAFGTIISQFVSAVAVLTVLLRTKECFKLEIRKIRFHLPILKEIVRIGIPSGMEMACYNVTNMITQTVVNGFGTVAMAAWAAVLRVDCMFYIVHVAYSQSVAPMVGQNFGAKQYTRVKQIVRTGIIMNMISMGVVVLFVCLFCPQVLGWFTSDQEVIEIGCVLLYSLALSNLINVFINILPGSIRACGESVQPMLITLFSICGLRLFVLVGLVSIFHTMRTVSLSWPISWGVTSVIFIVYYLKGNWLERCIRRQSSMEN